MSTVVDPEVNDMETGDVAAGDVRVETGIVETVTAHRHARLIAALVLVFAVAAAAITGVQAHRAAATAEARTDALIAAKTRVPELLSYENATLEDDLAQALKQTTGAFTGDYRKILSDVVMPTATDRKISTKASVSAAGVVSGDRDTVVVLLFLTQTTTAAKAGTSVSGSRVEVTMAQDGDEWKIAGLKPV